MFPRLTEPWHSFFNGLLVRLYDLFDDRIRFIYQEVVANSLSWRRTDEQLFEILFLELIPRRATTNGYSSFSIRCNA